MTYQALVQSKPHLKVYSRFDAISGTGTTANAVVNYFGPSVTGSITQRTSSPIVSPIARLSGSPDNRVGSLTYSGTGTVPDWYRFSVGTCASYAIEFWGNASTDTNPALFSDANGILYDTQTADTIPSSVSFTREAKAYIRVNDVYFATYNTAGTVQTATSVPIPPAQNEWTHYVFEVENTTSFVGIRIYVNGVKVAEESRASQGLVPIIQWSMHGFYTSTTDNTSWTNGYLISDMCFWGNNTNQRAVTDADIAERYAYGSKFKYFDGTSWAKPLSESFYVDDNPFRYVRWSAFGNTVNGATHFCEIQALTSGGTNRLLGTTPVQIGGVYQSGTWSWLTDNDLTVTEYVGFTSAERAIIQFDMGAVYDDISEIKFWHYYADGRSYYDVLIEVSTDGTNWKTVYSRDLEAVTALGSQVVTKGWSELAKISNPKYWNGTEWVNI